MSLINADCFDVFNQIADKSIDMVLCDLPYGTTQCHWDSVLPLDKLWQEYERVIKDDGAIVLTSAQPFTSMLIMSNLQLFRYEWIYEKPAATGFLNAKKQPLRAHESVLVFYKKQPTYNPQKTTGHERKTSSRNSLDADCYGSAYKKVSYDSTERYPRSVQKFKSDKQLSKLHPTQKPVSLCEYLIKTYTNKGETVLDNCMGSGTTGIACLNLGRKFIGIEKDKKYFEIASARIEQHSAQERLFA